MTIKLIGFYSEVVFAYTVGRFREFGPFDVLNLDDVIEADDFNILSNSNEMIVCYDGKEFSFGHNDAIYHRMFIRSNSENNNEKRIGALIAAFNNITMNSSKGQLIINRPNSGAINTSKAAQLLKLKQMNFDTPASILTTSKSDIKKFTEKFANRVVKGVSGVRTMVKKDDYYVNEKEYQIANTPIFLQEYIGGFDVRLHYVCLKPISLKIETEFPDYRYAVRNGFKLEFSEMKISSPILEKCRNYMISETQEFAAFDFRVEGNRWCLLEVNPMPGYSFYDPHCSGKISTALWHSLSRGYSNLYSSIPKKASISKEYRPDVNQGKV